MVRPIRFPYALWRDLVSDESGFWAWMVRPIRFPYALWRDLVSDDVGVMALSVIIAILFPYALWRDLVSDVCRAPRVMYSLLVYVSIRLMA